MMKSANAIRYTGTLELHIYLRGTLFYVSVWEEDSVAPVTQLEAIKLAPGKFSDDELDSAEAFDECARVAVGFASLEDEMILNYVELNQEERNDEVVVWRDRETALLMAQPR